TFQDLRYSHQVAALHFVRILFEADLPVWVGRANSSGKIRQDARDLPVFGNPAQTDIGDVRKRHHYGHAVIAKAEKVEPFERGSERASTNILNGSNALVGIDYFVADLERHFYGVPHKPPIQSCCYSK